METLIVYRGKYINWKKRFKTLLLIFIISVVAISYQQFRIKKLNLIIKSKNENIKILKQNLNFFAQSSDEKIESRNEVLYYNKKIQDKITSYNLGLYEKSFDFFNFPVENINESYTPYPSTEYGYRNDGFHHALDIQSPYNGNVLSTGDGVVYNTGKDYYAGNFIVIYHNIEGQEFLSAYHHLSSVSVTNKQKIKKGEKIGVAGSTGKSSSGIHVHFALYKKLKTRWVSVNFVTNSLHKKRVEVANASIYSFLLK
jgi:murein DD-endopeptidase MepM/ murein hydrolase activator NlpD